VLGGFSSIAIDSNNDIHISYYDDTNDDLKYATNTSGSFVISIIDSGGNVGQYTSIAIDSNNDVHISYRDVINFDLKYATNTSGSFVTSTIDSDGNVGQYSSLAIDSNNDIHIGFYDNTNDDLKYTTNTSGSFVTSIIDSEGDVGQYVSIAIDSNNNIYISYYDVTNGDLKYTFAVSNSSIIDIANRSFDEMQRQSANKPFIINTLKVRWDNDSQALERIRFTYKNMTGFVREEELFPIDYIEQSSNRNDFIKIMDFNREITGNITIQGTVLANTLLTFIINSTLIPMPYGLNDFSAVHFFEDCGREKIIKG